MLSTISANDIRSDHIQSVSSNIFDNTPDMDTDSVFFSQKNKPKRNHSSISSIEKKKSKNIFISTNRFAPLAVKDTANTNNFENQSFGVLNSLNEQTKRTPLPPPIIIRNLINFVSLRAELIDLKGPENFLFKR